MEMFVKLVQVSGDTKLYIFPGFEVGVVDDKGYCQKRTTKHGRLLNLTDILN